MPMIGDGRHRGGGIFRLPDLVQRFRSKPDYPFSYANRAPEPVAHERPAVPLAIGTNHFRQSHEVCATGYDALTAYLDGLAYAASAMELGPCKQHEGRVHYGIAPCQLS